jgi:bifunctional glutamyl/prolyl-tRNA synthetase
LQKSSNTTDIDNKIVAQGNLVRDLKTKKAPKPEIDAAVKALLELKAEFKKATGADWKPGQEAPKAAAEKPAAPSGDLDQQITKQGDIVRNLKSVKASKGEIDSAVKVLLDLKAQYKKATGSDWKPGAAPAPVSAPAKPAAEVPKATGGAGEVNEKIVSQGNLVRDLKAKKAGKPEIDAAVKTLLDLKAEYKKITGQDWKPGCVVPVAEPKPQVAAAATGIYRHIIHTKVIFY